MYYTVSFRFSSLWQPESCFAGCRHPYVTLLAKPGKESATLTLVQAFNSVATTIAPYVGGMLILTDASQTLNAAPKKRQNARKCRISV